LLAKDPVDLYNRGMEREGREKEMKVMEPLRNYIRDAIW